MGFFLGLSGSSRCGKDTMAEYLIRRHNWGEKVSFAENLKDLCKRIYSLSDFDVNDQEGKASEFEEPKIFTKDNFSSVLWWMYRTHGDVNTTKEAVSKVVGLVGSEMKTPREILQLVGTDVCRTLIPSYHLDLLYSKIYNRKDDFIIITDVRFPDEMRVIRNLLGGKVVKIVRDTEDGYINKKHASEISLKNSSDFDEVIYNTKDGLSFFYEEIDKFVERNKHVWKRSEISNNQEKKE